jgi:hypothetical protein
MLCLSHRKSEDLSSYEAMIIGKRPSRLVILLALLGDAAYLILHDNYGSSRKANKSTEPSIS